MEKNDTYFVVTYKDPEKLLEQKNVTLKVKSISDSNLGLGFIRLSNFLFEEGALLIDPNTDKLKKRFKNTKSFHLNIYSIVSIEEVGMEHQGLYFKNDKSNLHILPTQPN